MDAVDFEGTNVVIGEGQPEYNPLHARVEDNGQAITCWQLSPEELAQVQATGRIFLSQFTFGQPFQPVRMDLTLDEALKNGRL